MKNTKSLILSSLGLFTLVVSAIPTNAAPVKFSQVVQVVNAKPGKASIGSFAQLRLINDGQTAKSDDGKAVPSGTPPQDGRVIVTTSSEIVEDDACDCAVVRIPGGGFPKWPLFGLGAVPLFFLGGDDDDNPTPTPTPTITNTPPGTQTPTPPVSPTPTITPPVSPTPTPTITPPVSPTPPTPTPTPPTSPTPPMSPTPEPVPEPMTILLFGTGLAGIGVAARKRLRKESKNEDSSSDTE